MNIFAREYKRTENNTLISWISRIARAIPSWECVLFPQNLEIHRLYTDILIFKVIQKWSFRLLNNIGVDGKQRNVYNGVRIGLFSNDLLLSCELIWVSY